MLVGLHVPTNFQMYRQNSQKALLGGGGQLPSLPPPPPPPLWLYANAGNAMPRCRATPEKVAERGWTSHIFFFATFTLWGGGPSAYQTNLCGEKQRKIN